MAYKENTIAAWLDRVANRITGPGAHTGTGPRMGLIANLGFLAMGVAGMALVVRGDFGPGLLFAAMFGSTTHTVIVEYRKRGNAPLDEREQGVFWKSMAIGGMGTACFVALWALFLGPFADDGMWYPRTSTHWQAAGFFILGLTSQITNIAAACMTPAYEDDFDIDA